MSDDRGLSFGNKTPELKTAGFAHSRAYVIGINAYNNGIPQLHTAVADAARLAKLLKELHGYNVLTLPQDSAPTLETLRDLLHKKMPQEVGNDDRVLVYFACHGIALDGDDGPEGYLVPEDANREDRSSFLAMTELNDALAALPCRHLLLILDCCFAGAFRWSSTRDLSPLPSVIHRERYERYIQDSAWQVLTSAAYDQKALDVLSGITIGQRVETDHHSPFANALFRALQGEADVIPRGRDGQPGGDGVITATELYLYLRENVETATIQRKMRQTPGLWPLKKHDKGEFILLAPGHELNLPPAPELNYANNPYRGLQSFEEEHSQLFFGRTREIEELRSLVSSQPLTVVLGASGTGKSSVVKAGLLPFLRTIDGEEWQILPVMRPGKSPLATLANLALPGEATGSDEVSRLGQLWSDGMSFAQRIRRWAEIQPDGSRILLTIDQFEELITLCWDKKERDCFIAHLASAVNELPERVRLIITLRSDFEPQFSDCALKSQWMPSRYVVPAMSTDNLRQAIEGPASVRVLYFRPAELVDRLIDEVIQTPGAMPLLSFTLSELYIRYLERQSDDRCLTLADYEQLGGVAGSLRSRAAELYDSLDGSHQATMQRIMMRMVSAEGGELARRRVLKAEIDYSCAEENGRVAHILQLLSDARLVVEGREFEGDSYVEPAHDALIQGWPMLLDWVRKGQQLIAIQRLVTSAARDWESGLGGLWHANPRLALLASDLQLGNSWYSYQLTRVRKIFARKSKVSSENATWLNRLESLFVISSLRRRHRTTTLVASVTIVTIAVLSAMTSIALWQREQAKAALAQSESRRARSNYRLARARWDEGRVEDAIRYLDEIPEQHRFAEWDLSRRRFEGDRTSLFEHQDIVSNVRFSPDGNQLASGTLDGDVVLWNWMVAEPKSAMRIHQHPVICVAYSPEGTLLASGSAQSVPSSAGSLRLWNIDTGKDVTHPTMSQFTRCSSIEFSRDGAMLAAASDFGSIRIWNSKTGLEIFNQNTNESLSSIAFDVEGKRLITAADTTVGGNVKVWDIGSQELLHTLETRAADSICLCPSGDLLAVGGSFGSLTLWDIDSGKMVKAFRGHDRFVVCSLTFSPDAAWLVSASSDGTVVFWDMETGEAGRTLRGRNHAIESIAFNLDGSKLACVSDGTVHIWDITAEENTRVLRGHANDSLDVTFASHGQWLVSVGEDCQARLWNTATGTSTRTYFAPFVSATSVAVAPDNSTIAVGYWGDNIVKIWDVESGKELHSMRGRVAEFGGRTLVAFNRDGTMLASAAHHEFSDAEIHFWNPSSGADIRALDLPQESSVLAICFSPSSSSFAAGLSNHSVQIWDSTSGKTMHLLLGHNNAVTSVAYSMDGTRIATTSSDGTIKLWDALRGIEIASFSTDERLNDIAFNRDGNRLFVASGEDSQIAFRPGKVMILDSETGEELETLFSGRTQVISVACSRDGAYLASSTDSGHVNFWNLKPNNEVRVPIRSLSKVFDAAIRGDGSQIATSHQDKTLRLWDARTGDLLRTIQGKDVSTRLEFSADGSRLRGGRSDEVPQEWDLAASSPIAVTNSWDDTNANAHRSTDGRWIAIPFGRAVVLVDSLYRKQEHVKAAREAQGKLSIQWHDEQASAARSRNDWYAETFHLAWITDWEHKLDPPRKRFQTAFTNLKATYASRSLESSGFLHPKVREAARSQGLIPKPEASRNQ